MSRMNGDASPYIKDHADHITTVVVFAQCWLDLQLREHEEIPPSQRSWKWKKRQRVLARAQKSIDYVLEL